MPKGNQCCPHASLQLPPSVHPCSPRSQQLLPHATALKAAPSRAPARLLPKRVQPAEEEEEAEAEPSLEVGSGRRRGNLFYLHGIEENLPKPWHFTRRGLTSGGILSLGQPVIFLLALACCFLDSVKPNCCCMSPPPTAAFALSWKWLCRKLVAPSPQADPCIFAPMALGDSDPAHPSAPRPFSPLVIPSLAPVPEMRKDLKHRHTREGTA